jgi:hypothetical protein
MVTYPVDRRLLADRIRRPGRLRSRRPTILVATTVVAIALVTAVPELLGDWPYEPFGGHTHVVHSSDVGEGHGPTH